MASLISMPNELFAEISANLESIDDVHQLSQTCTHARDIIQYRTWYLHIMRSVILSSKVYRYDVQLCRLLDLRTEIVTTCGANQSLIDILRVQPSATLHTSPPTFESRLFCCIMDPVTAITDGQIDAIVARTIGLRPLHFLYMGTPPQNLCDTICKLSGPTLLHYIDKMQDREAPLHIPESHDRYLTPSHRARFHAALTHYWIINLIRWTGAHFQYQSPQIGRDIRTELLLHLDSQSPKPLLDAVDMLEVYLFLYQSLLPRHAYPLADLQAAVGLAYPSHSRGQTYDASTASAYANAFKSFHFAAAAALNPPDILELVVRDTVARRFPWPLLTPLPSTLALWTPWPALFTPLQLGSVHAASYAAATSLQYRIYNPRESSDPHLKFLQKWVERVGDRVLVGLSGVRVGRVLERHWADVSAGVWWWADNEDKACMKVRRWREGWRC